jgi:DNA-binding response OmpR family regulator
MENGTAGGMPGKILVVDDDPNTLKVVENFLKGTEFVVLPATSGEDALRVARDVNPDVVLLNLVMPGMSSHEVLRELKTQGGTSDIPVVVVSAVDQMAEKEKAIEEGADEFLAKPIERRELLIRLRTLLKVKHLHRDLERTLRYLHELEAARYADGATPDPQKGPTPPSPMGTILIVEDELLERAIYADMLRDHGYNVISAPTAHQALEFLRLQEVDVILVDLILPGMSGPELIERLQTISPDTPVIVVTAHPSSHNAITAIKLGAFDFIVKGFKNEVMLHAVKRALEKRELELQTRTLVQELKAKVNQFTDPQT